MMNPQEYDSICYQVLQDLISIVESIYSFVEINDIPKVEVEVIPMEIDEVAVIRNLLTSTIDEVEKIVQYSPPTRIIEEKTEINCMIFEDSPSEIESPQPLEASGDSQPLLSVQQSQRKKKVRFSDPIQSPAIVEEDSDVIYQKEIENSVEYQKLWLERKTTLEKEAERKAKAQVKQWQREKIPLQKIIDDSLKEYIELYERAYALLLQFEHEKSEWTNKIRATFFNQQEKDFQGSGFISFSSISD